VIGIAGGPDKCRFLTDTLKLDSAIDYKAFSTTEALAEEIERLTGGVDVYFDNVGGWITDAVIPLVKLRARVIICGQITQYEGKLDAPEMGPRFLHHLLFQRASITGILARDFTHRMPELLQILSPWVKDGSLVFEETIVEGFERLPDALNMLFDGRNMGKLIVKA
jgi:NADPH-dependent curcumin reductase CurA